MPSDIDQIARKTCTSTNLASYGYDEARRVLAVEFKSGAIIHYSSVDLGTFERMDEADSKGSFYAHHIKGRFTGEPMTGMCDKCGDKPGALGEPCSDCGCGVYRRIERGRGEPNGEN